uniref:Uncharacterized protein n=1 Tax=uncultured Armatimonadetes bacterium TaxID=157466 RepID=A0A6J4JHC4_9BACT|nr:hypothetical protein AVDCRST_MAG63-3483 [uncultured Armatimonadetes bacterium]
MLPRPTRARATRCSTLILWAAASASMTSKPMLWRVPA